MNGCSATDVTAFGHFAAENQNIFVESYATNVFHRAPVVFGNCNLIVLTKWIGQTESLFEIGKAFLGNFEDIFSINVLEERFTSVDSKRDCLLAFVFIMNGHVRTRNDCSYISRNHLRDRKLSVLAIAIEILCAFDPIVRDDFPMLWGDRANCESRFLIRLIEACVHAASITCFELGVEVNLIIYRVYEAMQAFAGI